MNQFIKVLEERGELYINPELISALRSDGDRTIIYSSGLLRRDSQSITVIHPLDEILKMIDGCK